MASTILDEPLTPPLLSALTFSVPRTVLAAADWDTGRVRFQSATKLFQLLSIKSLTDCLVVPHDRG